MSAAAPREDAAGPDTPEQRRRDLETLRRMAASIRRRHAEYLRERGHDGRRTDPGRGG